MNLINEFLNVLKEIRNDKLSYLFLFFQLVFFSGLVKQFGTDEILVVNIAFTSWLCLTKKRITNRNINLIFAALGVFALINVIPSFMWGASPKLLLGFSGRIFLGALIVVYFKHDFFNVFEKLVFVLAFISIPLFLIQLIHVQVFDLFRGFSNLVLSDVRLHFGSGELSGHRYLLVFLVNSWGELRNSGFMWEPAAFGAVLAWAMLVNVFFHRFSLNPRLIVLFLAAITTFSIGTYVYLAIFILIYLSKNFGNKNAFYFIILLILIPVSYRFEFVQNNLAMISKKIESEQNLVKRIRMSHAPKRVSRVGGFVGNIMPIIAEPFGFGLRYDVLSEQHFLYRTPNGFMVILRNWGISGLMIILICSCKLVDKLKILYEVNLNIVHKVLLMMIIMLPINGNPFYNQPFLIAILLSGFIVSKRYNDKSHATENHKKQSKQHPA